MLTAMRRVRRLLGSLCRPRTEGFWWYAPMAAWVAAAGSLAVLMAVDQLTGWLGHDPGGPSVEVGWGHFLGLVVLSPAVETALLLATLHAVRKAGLSTPATAALAALVWGGLHALVHPAWFFGTVWSFFVFACAAEAWRAKSGRHAYWAAALPHAMVNAAVFAVLALSAGTWPA